MKNYVFSDQCVPSSLYGMLLKLKPDEQLIVSIDASEPITEKHLQRIENIAKYMFEKQQSVQFVVYDAGGNRSKQDAVPYTCNEQQLQTCDTINQILQKYQQPSLGYSAYNPHFYWPYQQVVWANELIQDIVKEIKTLQLTPFESVLFIHQTLGSMSNSCLDGYSKNETWAEYNRSILSYYHNQGFVCVSYAHWTKAVIDALQMPGLSCSIELFDGYNATTQTYKPSHALNSIDIQDDVYGVQGTYLNDAFWSAENGVEGYNLATCMYPVADLEHVCLSDQGEKAFHNITPYTHKEYLFTTDKPAQEESIKDYIQRTISVPIPMVKYIKGATAILHKAGGFTPEECAKNNKQIINNTTLAAMRIFDSEAQNTFVKTYQSYIERRT